MWTEVIAGTALVMTAAQAYLVYRGSDRASQRTADAAKEANSTTGYQALTADQRIELDRAYARATEAELSAAQARDDAAEARESAESTARTMEKCQAQQEVLVAGYRELWEWANQACPHEGVPPQPPIRIWA